MENSKNISGIAIFFIVLFLFFVFILVCSESEEAAYERGYEEGREAGSEEDREEGYDEGYAQGQKDACEHWVEQGILVYAEHAWLDYDIESKIYHTSVFCEDSLFSVSAELSDGEDLRGYDPLPIDYLAKWGYTPCPKCSEHEGEFYYIIPEWLSITLDQREEENSF